MIEIKKCNHKISQIVEELDWTKKKFKREKDLNMKLRAKYKGNLSSTELFNILYEEDNLRIQSSYRYEDLRDLLSSVTKDRNKKSRELYHIARDLEDLNFLFNFISSSSILKSIIYFFGKTIKLKRIQYILSKYCKK